MRWNRPARALVVAAIGLTALNCSSDGDGGGPSPVATTLALVSGDAQTGTAGAALADPIIVKVTDQNGAAMANVSVAFAVTAGGGDLGAASVNTDANGLASTTWTLGTTAGTNNNTASASVTGLTGSPVTFTASAIAGAPTQLSKTAGDTQTGEVVQALAVPPKVTVMDALNNPVAGVTITWTVTSGRGSTPGATSMTDPAGEASMSWTLGPVVGVGADSLKAALAGGTSVTFTGSGVLTAGTLTINGGDNQVAVINNAVPEPPSVIVKTPGVAGVPVERVRVEWSVTAGGGSASTDANLTFANGIINNGWMLGGSAGVNNQSLTATVPGLAGSPVTFVATAVNPPTQMALVSGDGQTGIAGQPLPAPLVVILRDASNVPVPGITVSWLAEDGGGSLSGGTSTTDAAGHAAITLTVGTVVGSNNQTVTCTSSGLAGSPVTFTASVVAAAASQIAKSSGDAQTAAVGTLLPQPIAVVVKDTYGNVKSGVTVNWAAVGGSGSTTVASSVTDAAGIASTGWTIGTTAGTGNQSATGSVAGLTGSPVQFTASATAGPAATLAIATGDNQVATAGSTLPTPLAVLVTDAYGNGVGGMSVSWAAATGGGTMAAPTSMTGPSGAASNTWTLGGTIGAQTATATVAGTTPAMVTFNSTANPVVSTYNITLRYISAISAPRQAVFDAAAARWSTIITGDVPNVAMNIAAGSCGANSPALSETVDDVLIFVTVDSIDGPGTILGSAGPCYIRASNSRFSIIGRMTFDSADVANLETAGLLPATILHEMGHVLGIGTLWNVPIASPPPPLLIGAGTADPYFIGTTAIAQFNSLGGGTYVGNKVPVENMGGPGTRDGHWREAVMGKELMTGYISLIANPLSTITVGSLADAGYVVSYANADAYAVDGTNLMAADAGSFKLNEAPPDWTIKSVDASGRIVRQR